jgi:hypothetical protein
MTGAVYGRSLLVAGRLAREQSRWLIASLGDGATLCGGGYPELRADASHESWGQEYFRGRTDGDCSPVGQEGQYSWR